MKAELDDLKTQQMGLQAKHQQLNADISNFNMLVADFQANQTQAIREVKS
jgi:hypothetical protein